MNAPRAAPDLSSWPTTREAADTLQCSVKSIQRLIAAGKIEARKRQRKGKSPETICNPQDVSNLLPAAHIMPATIPAAHPSGVAPKPANSHEIFPIAPALQGLGSLLASIATAATATPAAKRWLTLQEASDSCGLSVRFLRRAILAGDLHAVRDGRTWKIRREDLDKL
jgi:excisionase family DNA binding protein